jgi:hypothetical protein
MDGLGDTGSLSLNESLVITGKQRPHERFTTSDIMVISLFGAMGIVVGVLGNVLHGLSGILPFIGPFLLHTVLPGVVIFACTATVRKVGATTLLCLISSLVSMPLMGAPLFIIMYLAYGILLDACTFFLKERAWTWVGTLIMAVIYGVVGILILYLVVLSMQGLVFPQWVILISIPVNILFAIPTAFIGVHIGKRARSVLAR